MSSNGTNETNSQLLAGGFKNGIPIGLGYFAVSFSLGITAKIAGITPVEGFFASLFTLASAGQYATFTCIAASVPIIELIIMSIIANARYLLMSCALSQKFSEKTPLVIRLMIGCDVTDEVFSATISRPGYVEPFYNLGLWLASSPMWALGTAIGIICGNILPGSVTNALSVALYGMFLAAIIPPAKTDRKIAVLVALSFVCSYVASVLPMIGQLSEGTRTIILTLLLAGGAAVLFPIKKEEEAC